MFFFFFQAEDGIRDSSVTGVQTCALPIYAAHAWRAALEMAARMEGLHRGWEEQAARTGRPFRHVNSGIGITTGECCVGNLGSTHRFDYSAVGDEVNVTSRLEGLTKLYGVTAVVGEATLAKSGQQFPALELDVVAVKGRTRSTRVFAFPQPFTHPPHPPHPLHPNT